MYDNTERNLNRDSHQNPSSFSSLQKLLEELESIITFESRRNNNPWMRVSRLSAIFREKHGVPLEELAQAQGYGDSLKSLFRIGRRFSIYNTQMSQEFGSSGFWVNLVY